MSMQLEFDNELLMQNNKKMKAERDTLIDDIAVLKANISRLESELSTYKKSDEVMRKTRDELVEKVEELERENERLLNQSNYYARRVELGEERLKQLLPKEHNYVVLTSHIRQKAEANPGVSRYIDLVNYIDRLERE
ncbi:hypothetical protein [Staphylococcus shinii]|uniref:hypothetical protein n=1 Tax=Staphylococcus shinii TaxID=2912228 RepID=UPI003F55E60E